MIYTSGNSDQFFDCHKFLLHNFEGFLHNCFRWKRSCWLHSENVSVVFLINTDGFVVKLKFLAILDTFVAEIASVSVLNIKSFQIAVVLINMSWAALDHFFIFCVSHSFKMFCIKIDDWLCTHDTSGARRPFGMSTAHSFLSNKSEVKNLVSWKLHDQYGVFWISILVLVLNRSYVDVFRTVRLKFDIIGSHVAGRLVGWAFFVKLVSDRTFLAEICATALTMTAELIYILTSKWH